MDKKRKAVVMISGGLDSMLAAKMMIDQGIHVEGINFFTGFCVEGHTHAIRKQDQNKVKRNNALWVAEQLGIKLHIIDVIEEYKDVVMNPKHGYGAYLNPCLDCKIFMVRKTKEWMLDNDFDFMVTGEVVGQRPMSQRKNTMPVVQKESGVESRLLRPLSALNLPETLPEKEGWVDRSLLKDISGRSRKEQMAMASEYNIDDYAQPAGGCCFLTNKEYSTKLQDLWQNRGSKKYELDDIMLLKVGRHIRPRQNFKLIVGREEGENNYMNGYRKQFIYMHAVSHRGPLVLIDGTLDSEEDKNLAARVMARFSQGRDAEEVTIEINYLDGTSEQIKVSPMAVKELDKAWYV